MEILIYIFICIVVAFLLMIFYEQYEFLFEKRFYIKMYNILMPLNLKIKILNRKSNRNYKILKNLNNKFSIKYQSIFNIWIYMKIKKDIFRICYFEEEARQYIIDYNKKIKKDIEKIINDDIDGKEWKIIKKDRRRKEKEILKREKKIQVVALMNNEKYINGKTLTRMNKFKKIIK